MQSTWKIYCFCFFGYVFLCLVGWISAVQKRRCVDIANIVLMLILRRNKQRSWQVYLCFNLLSIFTFYLWVYDQKNAAFIFLFIFVKCNKYKREEYFVVLTYIIFQLFRCEKCGRRGANHPILHCKQAPSL